MVAKLTEAFLIAWVSINVIFAAWSISVYVAKTKREKERGQ
jgi:hypothetical protein